MKRLIVSILIIAICMTGCSDHVPTNPVSKQAGIFYQETAVRCITDNYDVNAKHYIGTGIRSLKIDGKQLVEGDLDIIPVYEEEELIFLIVGNEDDVHIIDSKDALAYMSTHPDFIVFEMNGKLYALYADQFLLIDEDAAMDLPEEVRSYLEKMLNKKKLEDNILGSKRSIIKMVAPKEDIKGDSMYRNDRILVKFKEGDRIKQIEMYETFCKGKCINIENSSGIYIFTFEEMKEEDLKRLLNDSKGLPYIESASLDQKNELQTGQVSE